MLFCGVIVIVLLSQASFLVLDQRQAFVSDMTNQLQLETYVLYRITPSTSRYDAFRSAAVNAASTFDVENAKLQARIGQAVPGLTHNLVTYGPTLMLPLMLPTLCFLPQIFRQGDSSAVQN